MERLRDVWRLGQRDAGQRFDRRMVAGVGGR